MVSDSHIVLLECKSVEASPRVLTCDIILVNARKRKECMVCGFIEVSSLQDQFAPEVPMISSC